MPETTSKRCRRLLAIAWLYVPSSHKHRIKWLSNWKLSTDTNWLWRKAVLLWNSESKACRLWTTHLHLSVSRRSHGVLEGLVQSTKPASAKGYYMGVDWTLEPGSDVVTPVVCQLSAWAGKKDQNLLVNDIAELISRVRNEFLNSETSAVFLFTLTDKVA